MDFLYLLSYSFGELFSFLNRHASIWLPFVLAPIFYYVWLRYSQYAFNRSRKRVLLEIKIPKEIFKSPIAMEIVLGGLFQTGGDGDGKATPFEIKFWKEFRTRFIRGSTRPWSSLEIISAEGGVKFFIWVEEAHKELIHNLIYSQYPMVEVHVSKDYTQDVAYGFRDEYSLFGAELELTKEDSYPIKTYVDYGLDKDPKEEFKIDPLTPLLEFMGSLLPGEHAWMQIGIRAAKTKMNVGGFFGETIEYKKDAEALIEKLRKDIHEKRIIDEEKNQILPSTKKEEAVISALEKSLSKDFYECGIRLIYVAKKDAFRPGNVGGMLGSFKQFNSNELNGFKPGKKTESEMDKIRMYRAYQERGFYFYPFKTKTFILNTEELATVFHFPGKVAETPTFARIDSKKAEPPVNLPL